MKVPIPRRQARDGTPVRSGQAIIEFALGSLIFLLLIISQFIAVGSSCFHTEWGYAIAFLFFMLAIFIRPQGLFGGKG